MIIVIYTAVIWILSALMTAYSNAKKPEGFFVWLASQLVFLPIAGRVFGWW